MDDRDGQVLDTIRGGHVADLEEEWSALPQTLYTSIGWLRTCEGPDTRQDYAVLREDRQVRAGLVAYTHGPEAWIFNDPVALLVRDAVDLSTHTAPEQAAEVARLRADLAPEDAYPATVSVLPGGYLPGLVRAPGTGHGVVTALLDGLDDIARRRAARTTAVMHVPEDDVPLRAALTARGFVAFRVAGDCLLHTPWSDFAGYLATLPSKRRISVRREIAVFRDAGNRLTIEAMSALDAEHARLHAGHMRRYGHSLDEAGALSRIRSIQENNDGMGFVLEARDDRRNLVGFVLVYEMGGCLYPKMIGIRDGQPTHYAYFNLVYYGLLRYAVENGLRAIVYGPEAYDAKAYRGCTLEPRISYVRVPGPWRDPAARLAPLLDRRYGARMRAVSWIGGGAATI